LSGPGAGRLVDLGSGGGLPGLVVATDWPEAAVALLEANGRRDAFLRRAVERLGLETRVSVLEERAEVCGREPRSRAGFDGVLARSFGRPAVLAECAAPLLKVGGWLLVSEPPPSEDEDRQGPRWPTEPLHQLGLEPGEVIHEGFEYRTLRQREPCPDRFPRRNGVPAKRPLF
jgi:16S rRNA (guanine527-N7)-methyltransferase